PILGNRQVGCIIVDEVDSMLLDKGENSLYLSHEIPDLNFLKALYMNIWLAIHSSDVDVLEGTESGIDKVEAYIRTSIESDDIKIPLHLHSFVLGKLRTLILNAHTARTMEVDDPYYID